MFTILILSFLVYFITYIPLFLIRPFYHIYTTYNLHSSSFITYNPHSSNFITYNPHLSTFILIHPISSPLFITYNLHSSTFIIYNPHSSNFITYNPHSSSSNKKWPSSWCFVVDQKLGKNIPLSMIIRIICSFVEVFFHGLKYE